MLQEHCPEFFHNGFKELSKRCIIKHVINFRLNITKRTKNDEVHLTTDRYSNGKNANAVLGMHQ